MALDHGFSGRGVRAGSLTRSWPLPTWRLAAVAAGGAALVLVAPGRGIAVALAFDAVLLLLAACDFVRAAKPGQLRVERELPDVLTLGATGEVGWRVANPSRRRLRLWLADDLAPSLGAASRRARLVVPAGGWAVAWTTLCPSRRGRFDLAELVLRVEGPLGLAARQGRVRRPAVLRVLPRFPSRREAELRIARAQVLLIGLRSLRSPGGGTEFEALREYTVDDEFRRLDWAATARASTPIVRTYRAERNQTVVVLLDAGRTMAGLVPAAHGPVPRLDHAMDAAMALTLVATRLGDRAGLIAFAEDVKAVVPPGSGRNQLSLVTAALYTLQPQLLESDCLGAFAAALARFRRRSLFVVLTELAEAAVSQALLPALPLLARRHVVLIGAVRDPDVQRWAAALPADASAAYRKAAAVGALDERRRTIATLRSRGALVVDAPPGQLAGALADAYLDVKATGRL